MFNKLYEFEMSIKYRIIYCNFGTNIRKVENTEEDIKPL